MGGQAPPPPPPCPSPSAAYAQLVQYGLSESMNNISKESKTILLQTDRSKFYLELISEEDLKNKYE